MSPVYLQDGKILIQDGKIASKQGCCCGCWEQHCGCMCCQTVKWTLVRASDGETTHYSQVGDNCVAYLQIPDSLCVARARIQCSGYNATEDCDTDCTVVRVDYCVDGAPLESCEWVADPCPDALVSLTASLDCEQPEAEYGLTRGARRISASAACPHGGLVCPGGPTEWRIVDQDDDVWFMGDVLLDPNYLYNCKDPDVSSDCFQIWTGATRYILDDYFLMYGCTQPAGYRKDGENTLRLQVLGCNGDQWTDVTERCGGVPFGTATRGPLFCSADDQWFEPLLISHSWQFDYYPPIIAPGSCKCLTDPSTGLPVTYQDPYSGSTQCRHCGNTMAASSTGTGLSYLGHGEAVKFTNRVNGDGANAWNWEDSEGRFPADIPWNFYWGDKDIVIAGDLWQWKDCYSASQAYLSFNSVTVENGATMALSFNANSLTMNNGRLDTGACIASPGRMVATVGSATLNNNSEVLKATINCGGCEINGSFVRSEGIINGPCTLNSSGNEGTINGDCSFNSGSYNSGTVNGGTVSFDASNNWGGGEVNSDVPVAFANGSINEGTVDGDATFDQSENYGGTITGDATFDNNSRHHGPGVVQGNATFRNGSSCETSVNGDVTLYDDAVFGGAATAQTATFYDTSSMAGGFVNNAATFNNQSRMTGGFVSVVATLNDDACVTQEIHDDPGSYAGSFSPDPPPVCSP